MKNDYAPGVWVVVGYNKIANDIGNQYFELQYYLKPITFSFLHKLLGIDPNDPDPEIRNVGLCYNLDEERAAALQPYVVDGIIDLDKYDFMLENYAEGTEKPKS